MGLGAQKIAKVPCFHCERRIELGIAFCPHCEQPTRWASHDERVAWEVANYRRLRNVPLEPTRPMPPVSGEPPVRAVEPVPARRIAHTPSVPSRERPDPSRVREQQPVRLVSPVRAAPEPDAPTPIDLTQNEPGRTDPTRTDPTRTDPTRTDPTRTDPTRLFSTSVPLIRPAVPAPVPPPPAVTIVPPQEHVEPVEHVEEAAATGPPAGPSPFEENARLMRLILERLDHIEGRLEAMAPPHRSVVTALGSALRRLRG